MEKPTCLVTGATGFIGSHLARALVADGRSVHVLARPDSPLSRIEDIAADIRVHRCGLDDPATLADCVRAVAPREVYHLAAQTRSGTSPSFDAAREGLTGYQTQSLNLLEALAQSPEPPAVMVRTGTLAEYGSSPAPSPETMREAPASPYGAAMTAAAHTISMLSPILPFPVVTVRLGLVYGPDQAESFFIPFAIRALLEGRAVRVNSPADRRDLVYVGDVVEALPAFAEAPQPGHTILNLSSGHAPRTDELAAMIAQETGADPDLVTCRPAMPGEGRRELLCSTEFTESMTGWRARTPLRQGLASTVEAIRRKLPIRV